MSFDRLIAIAGLPRSGTTVTTAVLAAHPDVLPIYEPWNANKTTLDPKSPMTFEAFAGRFVSDPAGRTTLVVKETTTALPYLARINQLLADPGAPEKRVLIVPMRDPFHIFLSEVQARREWWGEPDTEPDATTFTKWLARTRHSLRALADVAVRHDAWFLSYERFGGEEASTEALTCAIGLEPAPEQAHFERSIDPRVIRGDQRMAEQPRALSDRSARTRAAEFRPLVPALRDTPGFSLMQRLRRRIGELPLLSHSSEQPILLKLMRERDRR